MKRGMVAVLLLVLLTSLTGGSEWVKQYQGTWSWNLRDVTGQHWIDSVDQLYVTLWYDTTPFLMQVRDAYGNLWYTGQFDREGTKINFRLSNPQGGGPTYAVVGTGVLSTSGFILILRGSGFWWDPSTRGFFGQYRFRGEHID
jgi:hypothetical protein